MIKKELCAMDIPYRRAACLVCASPHMQPWLWIAEAGIPHNQPRHHYAYSYSAMAICGSCDSAQLEQHSHDCWNHYADEDWDMYWWYVLDQPGAVRLDHLLTACPARLRATCTCRLHRALQTVCERLSGGITHATDPNGTTHHAAIRLDVHHGNPMFVVRR
jgi:hypothetical protein